MVLTSSKSDHYQSHIYKYKRATSAQNRYLMVSTNLITAFGEGVKIQNIDDYVHMFLVS